MTPDEAIAKLTEVPCPSCLTLGSLVIMVCGPGWGDCEWVGQCPNCGYKFDVEFAAAALDRLKREARVRERVDPCPACGAHNPEIHFACDTRKHTCFFVATCQACEHTFRIPPSDPSRCTFARVSVNYSADLTTRIEACFFGGNPDCSQCGCAVSAGLHWLHERPLGAGLKVGHLIG